MRDVLVAFLVALEEIGEEHDELTDTDVREQMHEAVMNVFIDPREGYTVPETFGMYSPEGDAAVRRVLERFLPRLVAAASEAGLATPKERLIAFQDTGVETPRQRSTYDEFFGYLDPDGVDW
jgi:hypothetical protein